MKLPNWFKLAWWGGLTILLTLVLYERYTVLIAGHSAWMDIVVFLLWFALMLAPIFQEIDIFGIKLKQEIEVLKKDLSYQLIAFKSDIIQSSIDMQTQINSQINVPITLLPQATALKETEKKAEEFLGNEKVEDDFEEKIKSNISEDIKFMFALQFLLEQEVRGISFKLRNKRERYPIFRLIEELFKAEIIGSEYYRILRDLFHVTGPGIHGEEIDPSHIRFVKKYGPRALSWLKKQK